MMKKKIEICMEERMRGLGFTMSTIYRQVGCVDPKLGSMHPSNFYSF